MISKNIVLKNKFKKYFSEVTDKLQTKIDLNQFHFLIFLGGKNRGKSYVAFQKMFETIKNGGKAVYFRNSLQEIKNIKNWIGGELEQLLHEELWTSDEGIFTKKPKRQLVKFATIKNYNNISGNIEAFDFLFYDEYNQELQTDDFQALENFVLILNTVFRNKNFKVWVCGNTKTKNNVFFNLFKIDPDYTPHAVNFLNYENYIGVIRYDDSVFTEPNANTQDLQFLQQANPELYDQFFAGKNYGYEDELILNNVNLPQWTQTQKYLIINNFVYQLRVKNYCGKDYYVFCRIFENPTKITGEVYTNTVKWINLCRYQIFEMSNFLSECLNNVAEQRLFFCDYVVYNFVVVEPHRTKQNFKNLFQ